MFHPKVVLIVTFSCNSCPYSHVLALCCYYYFFFRELKTSFKLVFLESTNSFVFDLSCYFFFCLANVLFGYQDNVSLPFSF